MATPHPAETPLRGVSVLVTRTGDDAAPFRASLEALGATVLELPTISIVPPIDARPLEEALGRLGSYAWIAFTSRHAVRAVLKNLPEPSLLSPRIAAIGPSTAAELRSHHLPVHCEPAEATAAGLAEAMTGAGVAGARVLLPQGDIARAELASRLRAAGAVVDEVIAYQTVKPLETRRASLEALRGGQVDVIAVASPSALRNLVAMLGVSLPCLQYVKLVCIGSTTAAAAREFSLAPAAVASRPTTDGMIQAIVDLYRGENP